MLIHPSAVMWDYFERVIPLLEVQYHLVVPALPGYDEEQSGDYTSVEEIAAELAGWLRERGHHQVYALYGCSMGGSVVIRMLADQGVHVERAFIDGGITPYQLPYLVTRLIAVRDFLMVSMGKFGGMRLLERAFSTGEYSEENLAYVAKVLNFMSYRTIWRTFESCNNYRMPRQPLSLQTEVQYWYAQAEEKDRAWDIRYVKRILPGTEFVMLEGVGHGGLALEKPEEFARRVEGKQ